MFVPADKTTSTNAPGWSVKFDYYGHPVFGRGEYVGRGVRFDAMVKVRDCRAATDTF